MNEGGLTGRTKDVRDVVVGWDAERDATGGAIGRRALYCLSLSEVLESVNLLTKDGPATAHDAQMFHMLPGSVVRPHRVH